MLNGLVDAEVTLIENARNGDRSAFSELVRRHYTTVTQVVTRMCGDASLAEDATQEAFLRAWLKLPTYQPRAPLRNWLVKIAMNACLDILRRHEAEPIGDEDTALFQDGSQNPEAVLVEKEMTAMIQQAVRSLPSAARSVLVLREYSGFSYQEIAGILDIPIGTVMSRLNYARTRLREILSGMPARLEPEYA